MADPFAAGEEKSDEHAMAAWLAEKTP